MNLEYGDIVHTQSGQSDWIILTGTVYYHGSERYLCLFAGSGHPIICGYRGQHLIKQDYNMEKREEIYSWVKDLPPYSGKWADYLRKNPIPDKFFKLRIFEPYEIIKIEKINRNGQTSYTNIKVSDRSWRTIDRELRIKFEELFKEESDIIELRFAGIIGESGMCSVWLDKFIIRSWAQKRGESFYYFDTNGWI